MAHLLELHHWPDDRGCDLWREEAWELLIQARKTFTPSMRRRLDLGDTYADAVRTFVARGGKRDAVPSACPFRLDDLLARDDLTRLLTWPSPPENRPC